MYWYVTAVSLLLLLAAATSIVCALYAWKRRPVPGSIAFSIFMLAIAFWVLAYLLQIASVTPAMKLAWTKLQYIGIGIVPVAWLVFSLRYTGRQAWLTPKNWTLLISVPVFTILLVVTNDLHQLVWIRPEIVSVDGLSFMTMTNGVWYWLFILYSYSIFLVGSLFILTSTRYEIASLMPQQALLLFTGLALPWFGAVLHLTNMSALNLTPLLFALCGIVVAKYPLNFRFMKRTPLENQMAINCLNDGVLILDSDCFIVDANPAMEKVAKRPLSTIIGSPLQDLFPEVAAKYTKLKENPIDMGCDEDRTTDCFEVRLTPLLDWRKFASSELLVFHDISLRKKQETLQSDLTHSMVHDLRSPISNSLFALEMLKNGTVAIDETEGQRLIDLTYENTEKVLTLVNDILDVGQLEDGRIPVHLTAVSLPKLVDKVILSQSPSAESKGITLLRNIPADLPVAWIDEALIERVIQNLIDNSIKFSPLGGTITVTAVLVHKEDHQQRRIHVAVTDEGAGLPPHLVETIFDKYVTGTTKESGNGLGLAFCQMAITAHNQKIWVEGQAPQGSAFTFSLALPPQLPEDIETEWIAPSINSAKPDILLSQAID